VGIKCQFERNLDTEKVDAIVAAIELSSEAPVVRVDTVEREEGVDTLALHRSVAPRGATRFRMVGQTFRVWYNGVPKGFMKFRWRTTGESRH
jgi:hypothetical protein